MKKIFNFVKNNGLLILAAFWFISFVIDLITTSPSTLDATARKLKSIDIDLDLLWFLVTLIEYGVVKVHEVLSKRIDLVDKRVDLIFDFINKAVEEIESKEKAEAEEKEVE